MDFPKALQLNWHLLVFPIETSKVQIPPPPLKKHIVNIKKKKKKNTWIFKKCLEGLLIGRYIFIKNIHRKSETLGPLSCFQSVRLFMQSWQGNSSIMSCYSLYTITSLYEIYHQFCQLAEIYIILFEKKEVQLSHRLLVT